MNKHTREQISKIPGWLTRREGEFLMHAARFVNRLPGVAVEIGSFMGKSTVWIASGSDHVYAIDPHKGEFSGGKTGPTRGEFIKNLEAAGVKHRVTPIVKTSQTAAASWNKPVSFLFIDGLHDYDHALQDFSLWSKFLIEGGIVAMHDAFCGWDGAGEVALRHIVYNQQFTYIGVAGSIVFGIKGKPSIITRIFRWPTELLIELSEAIYSAPWISKDIAFFLVHKFLKLFLVNRFTLHT